MLLSPPYERMSPPAPLRPGFDPGRARFERRLARLLRQAGIRPALLGRHRGPAAHGGPDGVSNRIRRVQEYVEGHVEGVRALDELAEVAGLSRYHFARRFRDEVGEPPWAFVRRVRDERARGLLREGHAPAEVAHAAGFADQAHLTRALRARYGQTPGQIRRAADEAPAEDDAEDRKDVQDPAPAPA